MSTALPPDLGDTRPSTRLVYTVLGEEWLTYAEVRERTGLSPPSTSRACQRLDELDLVERRRNPDEPRAYQVRLTRSSAISRTNSSGPLLPSPFISSAQRPMPEKNATASLHVPEAVREATDLPGRLAYTALAGRAPLTVEEVVTHTGVSKSAVKRALAELRDAGLIEADTHPVDSRRKLYSVVGSSTPERKDLEI